MSNKFKSTNTLRVYEVDKTDTSVSDLSIYIKEHWNRKDFVVLKINGYEYAVLANQLKKAIDNAQNAHQ